MIKYILLLCNECFMCHDYNTVYIIFMTYSTSCCHFDNLRTHELYLGMYVSFVSNCSILYSRKTKIIQRKFSQPGYTLSLGRSDIYLVFGMQKTLFLCEERTYLFTACGLIMFVSVSRTRTCTSEVQLL